MNENSSPIRILHIVTYMGRGGLETMLMNYYRHIDRSRVQFDFLVHRDFEADYDQEILSLGGKIHRISRLIPWSGNYRKELKAFFNSHPEYKIVHVHQDCLSSVALQCAKECGIPVRIAHCHSSSQDKNLRYLIKRYYMRLIPTYATDLFACSQAAGNWMFRGAPFRVIPNGIFLSDYRYDPETAHTVRQSLALGDGPVIGHVGRFDPVKNHTFLLDIFRHIIQTEPRAKLLLVGDGALRNAMEEKAATLGIREQVVFAGLRSDVPQLLQAMDAFAFPSIYEGLPVSIIEAQAAGLPCLVSTGVPAECALIPELVSHKSLETSAEEWAAELLKMAAMPREDHSDELRSAGYDITANATELEEYYLEKYC